MVLTTARMEDGRPYHLRDTVEPRIFMVPRRLDINGMVASHQQLQIHRAPCIVAWPRHDAIVRRCRRGPCCWIWKTTRMAAAMMEMITVVAVAPQQNLLPTRTTTAAAAPTGAAVIVVEAPLVMTMGPAPGLLLPREVAVLVLNPRPDR
jgi:hypothetical protein